ncbi:hypothetical protein KVR01_002035 [Diaporthe batatas]|uniref:uncharacterized protein n=1 Tax=Diaporthe batatas TaxID=748121 RepID=UPI001D040BD1|nr:uncharacterized protein KVR01_002035 [Diaporthe batatas]KAG8166346.1 hypothetical protein KVR01_002035 [Diaporthe batatas]
MDTSVNGTVPPDWPPGLPTRAALDILELALTDDTRIWSCGYPRLTMAQGNLPKDPNPMLFIERPVFAQSIPNMAVMKVAPQDQEDSDLELELESLSFGDLSMMVVDNIRDALLSPPDQHDADSPANTTKDHSLALHLPLHPQPNGILQLDSSIDTPTSSPHTGVGDVIEQQTDDLNGSQLPNKSQLVQSEADLEPPEGVETQSKPKRIVKIKSREAVLYYRELNRRDEMEANIERRIANGETRPSSESAHFDEAVWNCDAGFDVPGDYAWLDRSR